MAKDLGDYAFGRVVTTNDHYLTRPAAHAGGTVVGTFPMDRRHVQVQTRTGVVTIRVRLS